MTTTIKKSTKNFGGYIVTANAAFHESLKVPDAPELPPSSAKRATPRWKYSWAPRAFQCNGKAYLGVRFDGTALEVAVCRGHLIPPRWAPINSELSQVQIARMSEVFYR